MRVLLRADAGGDRGTGHVMRCLTLAETLRERGHDPVLLGSIEGVGWLDQRIRESGVPVLAAEADSLELAAVRAARAERVVVDSYRIPADTIGAVDAVVPVLAIVDGDTRGIRAHRYLDQNLGAERTAHPPEIASRMLAGARYALTRSEILAARRERPWEFRGAPPRVLAVLGGTDPTAAAPAVAGSLAGVRGIAITMVAAPAHLDAVRDALADASAAEVIAVTPELPALLAEADVVVSAAGTSAWDVGALGAPAVLIGVVDNQRASLAAIAREGIALTIDASRDPRALAGTGELVARLLADEPLRRTLAERCRAVFDGRGAERVAVALEQTAG